MFIILYILVVVFTVIRYLVVSIPLKTKFKSKKYAWKSILLIVLVSILINLWVLRIFNIETINETSYCQIKQERKNEYFETTIVYIMLVIGLPIMIIFLFNILTICKMLKSEKERKNKLQAIKVRNTISISSTCSSCTNLRANKQPTSNLKTIENTAEMKSFMRAHKLKPHYLSRREQIKLSAAQKYSNAIAKASVMLMVISLSYCILNMPYLCAWFVYFTKEPYGWQEAPNSKTYLLLYTKIAETIQILNYSLHFISVRISVVNFSIFIQSTFEIQT